jgi:hypothetical protein
LQCLEVEIVNSKVSQSGPWQLSDLEAELGEPNNAGNVTHVDFRDGSGSVEQAGPYNGPAAAMPEATLMAT